VRTLKKSLTSLQLEDSFTSSWLCYG